MSNLNGDRITAIESEMKVFKNEISHLVRRLDTLTRILTTIAVLLGGGMLTFFGFLVQVWVERG